MATSYKLSKQDKSTTMNQMTFMTMIESLMYLANLRLYLMKMVGYLSQFQENSIEIHVDEVKRVSKHFRA